MTAARKGADEEACFVMGFVLLGNQGLFEDRRYGVDVIRLDASRRYQEPRPRWIRAGDKAHHAIAEQRVNECADFLGVAAQGRTSDHRTDAVRPGQKVGAGAADRFELRPEALVQLDDLALGPEIAALEELVEHDLAGRDRRRAAGEGLAQQARLGFVVLTEKRGADLAGLAIQTMSTRSLSP